MGSFGGETNLVELNKQWLLVVVGTGARVAGQ